MGRTYTKKVEAREQRLSTLPRAERLAKQAEIKKKEGRVLDASEKHALKMTTEYGDILRLWEILRTVADPNLAQQPNATLTKKEKKAKKEAKKTAAAAAAGTAIRKKFDEDDDDDEEEVKEGDAAPETAAAPKGKPERNVVRYEHKYATIDKLMGIIAPKFATLANTPRVSRVIQSMIKYGAPHHLEKITTLLGADFANFCNDAFCHFTICALIRHAPHALYKKILALLVPAMPLICSHKFGVQVVHAAYCSKLCSSLDRNLLLLGVFKDSVTLMKHWRGYPVLEDILVQEVDHQKRLIQRLFDLTDKLISQKDCFSLPFVQRLVHAFLKHGTKHEITELCVTLKPHLGALCESKEGSVLASLAFSLLEPRARKDALRQFSDRLAELAVGKYSSPVIARVFDLVYDAQILYKFVAHGVEEHLEAIVNSPYGFNIILHLVTPDEQRRERIMLPGWKEHNLYSTGNALWNTHSWLDVEYRKETVEICNKNASRTHLSVLEPIVKKFVALISDAEKKSSINKTHAGLIAREILHVVDAEPLYASTLKLSDEDKAALHEALPNKDKKDDVAEGDDVKVAAKKVAGGAKTARDEAGDSSAPLAKKRRSEPAKAATTATVVPPAKKPESSKPVAAAVPAKAAANVKAPIASAPKPAAAPPAADDDAPVERSARKAVVAEVTAKKAVPVAAKKGKASPPKMK